LLSSNTRSTLNQQKNNINPISKPLIKKVFIPKSNQRIIPPPKVRQTQANGKLKGNSSNTFVNLDETKIYATEISSSNLFPKIISESELFQFKPTISSSIHTKQEFPNHSPNLVLLSTSQPTSMLPLQLSSTLTSPPPMPPPPPPPPPLFFTSTSTQIPSSKSISSSLSIISNFEMNKFKAEIPKPPTSQLFSSELFKNELSKVKNFRKLEKTFKEEKINSSNYTSNKSFDLNEIKNFKFKNSANQEKKELRRSLISQNTNPWDSLMNEIRSNEAVNKLKKVTSSEKKSKHMKFNSDFFESDSNLVRDLNQILNERSQFFKEDDDENNSSDDDSWNCNKS